MRRTASEVIRNLEQRVARLERQAKKKVDYVDFIDELSKGLGVNSTLVSYAFIDWADNHPRRKFFGPNDRFVYDCTYTYDSVKVSDTGSITVDVEISSFRGEKMKQKINGFIDDNGKVQFTYQW